MKRIRRGFKHARIAAKRSKLYSHRVGAALFRKKQLVSVGYNTKKTHPNCPNELTQHAEFNVTKGFSPEEIDGCTLYIVRLTRTGKIGISKPCADCADYLRSLGLKKVYFSNEEGEIQEWKELNSGY